MNLKKTKYLDIKLKEDYHPILKSRIIAKKEILKSHILKQDKPTRKRMKQTLKKSKKLLAKKPLVPHRKVVKKRKKILDQRKLNKIDY